MNADLERYLQYSRMNCSNLGTHLSADGTAFPAGKRSNLNPIRDKLLEEGEGAIDYFAVKDVVPEEERGRSLEIATSK